MTEDNKLNISDKYEFLRQEELLSKKRAAELYDKNIISSFECGTFKGLSQIHHYLFQDVYNFAGQIRNVNLAKGNFRFAPVLYLHEALKTIDNMPFNTYEEIINKYTEMNVAHPFREGNGRSGRIWLDMMLKKSLSYVIDWSRVNKSDYLHAMERSPIDNKYLKSLLKTALTDRINDREIYIKGIDASYYYEGLDLFKTE